MGAFCALMYGYTRATDVISNLREGYRSICRAVKGLFSLSVSGAVWGQKTFLGSNVPLCQVVNFCDLITEAVDWWPQIVSVSDMLGDGVLNAGNEATGQVAGVVIKPAVGRRSEPVLVWEQAGIRYVIQLEQ